MVHPSHPVNVNTAESPIVRRVLSPDDVLANTASALCGTSPSTFTEVEEVMVKVALSNEDNRIPNNILHILSLQKYT